MSRSTPRAAILLLLIPLFVLLLAMPTPPLVAAPGDWPVGRHDSQRTGVAELPSSFAEAPTATWRQYVGGSLSAYVMEDVDGDGQAELFYLAGGVLYHKTADDTVVWQRSLAASDLYGPMDLDGDGGLELLAVQTTPVQLTVLEASSGAILWSFDDSSEIGTVGRVLIRDLDLDGVQDLLIEESHCGTYNSGRPGFAYTFTGGFDAPIKLYDIGADCGSSNDLFADLDGTGQQYWEIGYSSIKGTDSATGTVLYSLSTDVLRGGATRVEAVDLDQDGTDELVFLNAYYKADVGVPRYGVWDLDPDSGQLFTAWERPLSDPEQDRIVGGVRWLGDLDGDGSLELAISLYSDQQNAWTLKIVDALTGEELAQMVDQVIASVVDLEPDGGLEILTYSPDGDHLYAWRWTEQGLSPMWDVAYRVLLSEHSRADGKTTPYADVILWDVDGDGQVELPLGVLDEALDLVDTVLVDPRGVSGGAPAELARADTPEGFGVQMALRCDGFAGLDLGLCQVRRDGYLQALDGDLTVVNQEGPEPAFLPGLQLGGYLPSDSVGSYPLVARLTPDGVPVVWTRTSQGKTVALDSSQATLYLPPEELFAVDALSSLAIADLEGDGDLEFCFIDQDRRLHARRADGATDAWTAALAPADASARFGVLTGDANGDGYEDVFYTWFTRDLFSTVIPVSGRNGIALWDEPFAIQASWGAYPFAVADMDGDGDADIATTWNNFYVVEGSSGATLLDDGVFRAYGLPMPWEADGDATLEVLQQAGYYPDRLLDLDLSAGTSSVTWDGGESLRTGQQGVVVDCGAGDLRFVKGYASDDRFQVMDPWTGDIIADWVAASGSLYVDDAARDGAGARGGQLTSMIASPDLTGDGQPAVLFGSTDGHLYAFDACLAADSLIWSLDFGSYVGAPILADSDGDGLSEVLVQVGDGYLYHMDRVTMPAVDQVWDWATLPGEGDVDEVTTVNTLFAGWEAVVGAEYYEVGVLSVSGAYVSEPPFSRADELQAAVEGLELCDGATYRVAVRAIGADGTSVERLSDGVLTTVLEVCDGLDNNCDGRADEGYDGDGDGSVSCETDLPADCDDLDALTYPGADELCDGNDNDCDGEVDEDAVDATLYYGDTDKDGYGNPDYTKLACEQPRNFVTNAEDCDDTEATVYPGAEEICDRLDNDCDGEVDEAVQSTFYVDGDGDGYGTDTGTALGCTPPEGYADNTEDCDDQDATISPAASEICDGLDNNCDGAIDEGVQLSWYEDLDADGFGGEDSVQQGCTLPEGAFETGGDCDDTDATIHPEAEEVCEDQIDQDCNGYDLSCDEVDQDGDLFSPVQGDCDDGDPTTYPGAEEVPYDGIDQDCADGDLTDQDGDGFEGGESGEDCDDLDPYANPEAEEVCNGKDSDCNGVIDDRDADQDGEVSLECGGTDCNDSDPRINTGAEEVADNLDNDCDGVINEGTEVYDDDGDGWTEQAGDCDDTQIEVYPGAEEIDGDGLDNNCDGVIDGAATPEEPTPEEPTPDQPTPEDGTPLGTPTSGDDDTESTTPSGDDDTTFETPTGDDDTGQNNTPIGDDDSPVETPSGDDDTRAETPGGDDDTTGQPPAGDDDTGETGDDDTVNGTPGGDDDTGTGDDDTGGLELSPTPQGDEIPDTSPLEDAPSDEDDGAGCSCNQRGPRVPLPMAFVMMLMPGLGLTLRRRGGS